MVPRKLNLDSATLLGTVAGTNRLEALRNLRFANGDAAFSTAFITLASGTFLVGFVELLGGSDLWIGLLTAIPSLVGLVQVPGAIVGRRFATYKKFVMPGGLAWRLLYIPLIPLPLLPIPAAAKLTILALCVGIASASVVFVNPTYNEWLAEMVPAESRGFFFSRRNAITTAVGAVVGIVGAIALDAIGGRRHAPIGFVVVFAASTACAFVSFAFFAKMTDLPRAEVIRESLRDGIRALARPARDKNFRRVLIFLGVFMVGQVFAGNLYFAYALETLHLPFTVVVGTTVMQALGIVLASGMWGFLSDKYGNRPVLILSGLGIATNSFAWLLTNPANPTGSAILLLCAHVLMGVFWCGVNLAQFNLLLATADPADRAPYLGAGMTVQAVVGGIAPLLGAWLMATLRVHLEPVTAYKIVFGSAFFLRALGIAFLVPVREEGSENVQTTLRHLRKVTPRGMMAMRHLTRSDDSDTRESAIRAAGVEGYAFASDEIIKALHDPSPKVRRQAATSIATLRDPRGAAELIHQLEEHPDLVEEETIEALGMLGDSSATPALTKLLRSPSSILRRAAAKALGRIADPAAVAALVQAAGEPGDIDVRRAALQALRLAQAADAAQVVADALFDPHPSVRIAAAEAVEELELHSAAVNLRLSLESFEDEASSEIAYALGSVGELSDVPTILREAKQSVSIITRRRCLLGVARLLGVEREVYHVLLLDGMTRDTELMEVLKPLLKSNKHLRAALDRFSRGDEAGALTALAETWKSAPMAQLAAEPVEEGFLVAVIAGVRGTKLT